MGKESVNMLQCPFCGSSKVKVMEKYTSRVFYKESTMSVRCNVCHSRGPVASGITLNRYMSDEEIEKVKPRTNKPIYKDSDDLKQVAIEKWNNRINSGQ